MDDPNNYNNIKPSPPSDHHRHGQSSATNSTSSLVVVNNDQLHHGVGADDHRHMALQLSNVVGSEAKSQGRMLKIGGPMEVWAPPGFRFMPKDWELIMDYLMPKLWNQPLPCAIIESVNIYDYTPVQLTERYKRHSTCSEWFFFTPREKKYPNGRRPKRAAGDGFWKATGADKPIIVRGREVGFRKALVYYRGKPPQGTKTNWIMHEYRTDNAPSLPKTTTSTSTSSATDMRLDEWVLCRIYQKIGRSCKETASDDPQMNGPDEDDGLGASQDQEDQRAEEDQPDATNGGDVNQMGGYNMNIHDPIPTHGDVNQIVAYDMSMMDQQGYNTYHQDLMMYGSYDHVNDDMLRMNYNHNHNQGEVVRREESYEYKMQQQQPVIPRIEHAIDHRQRIGNYFPTDHDISSNMYYDGSNNNGGCGNFVFTPDDDDDNPLNYLTPRGFDPRYDSFGDCSFNDIVSIPPDGIGRNSNTPLPCSEGTSNNAPPDRRQEKEAQLF